MYEQPRMWQYGLIARWWAEFNAPDATELAFYRGVIERDGQPALDLGCGAGASWFPCCAPVCMSMAATSRPTCLPFAGKEPQRRD
jgi:hypothetical protein